MNALKVKPDFGLTGRQFVVTDDATLAATVRQALDMSPAGRVTIELDEPYDASRFCGPPSFCDCAKAMKARGDDITRPRSSTGESK
jgi:hypothetical protein